jgi:glycosyltransferase involved in cell wall biosynthesis
MNATDQIRNPQSEIGSVLFVLNSLHVGGMEQMVLALGRALNRRGRYRPAVACLSSPGALAEQARADGIAVVDHLLRRKLDFGAVRRLARLFRGEEHGNAPDAPAAVVVVNPGGDRMFWPAIARGRRPRRPPLVLWTQRTPLPGRHAIRGINRLLVGRFDAFAVLGPRQADIYSAFERFPRERIHVVSNGLERSRMDELAARRGDGTRAAVRAGFGVTERELVVLCVANIRPIKRVDLFCRAADTLRDRPLRFWLAGDAPDDRGRQRMAELIRQFDLAAPRFQWLGLRTDLDRLLAAADIAVCCSDSEGLSVSMLDSMAAGVPFVSTAVGEHPTVIEDGRTGLLIPPGSSEQLMRAIERLADDDALRTRLAGDAARAVREHYTIEQSAEAFERLVDSLRVSE